MIARQETFNLSPYMALYDLIIPKDNILRQINELVDFSFILDELQSKYCLDNGRNAIPPIRMFKYLLFYEEGFLVCLNSIVIEDAEETTGFYSIKH